MKRFFQAALKSGIPFGVAMGIFYYIQRRSPLSLFMGLIAGLVFGVIMALYQGRRERRLAKMGIAGADMNPVQERSVPVPLDSSVALEKARAALTSIRKLRTDSIQVTGHRIAATTGITWQSFGERIAVEVQPTATGSLVHVSSRPRLATTTMDGGKGLENVELFVKDMTL